VTDWSSPLRTLREWEQDHTRVTRTDVEHLLIECGYTPSPAGDYPNVAIFEKKGWPRWALDRANPKIPVRILISIIARMTLALTKDNTV
jgi:hypothetical protein